MDSSLRSSLPHLTRWFTTVLGQNEVKEVMAGLNLKESVPKGAPAAPKNTSPPGKGRYMSTPQGNWHQNSQTSFAHPKALHVCKFLPSFPFLSTWHQNSRICFVCSELKYVDPCPHHPMHAFASFSYSPSPCLDDPRLSLPVLSSCQPQFREASSFLILTEAISAPTAEVMEETVTEGVAALQVFAFSYIVIYSVVTCTSGD